MVQTTSHIFSGKVDVESNLKVGSSHFFVDTTNNRVGITTADPHASLHVNGNAYVDTNLNVGTAIELNQNPGHIKATSFEGDGSLLSGVASTLSDVVNNGNVTSNTVQFTNTDTGIVTTGNVNVGNKLSVSSLTPGNVPYVNTTNTLENSYITQTVDTISITSNLEVLGNVIVAGNSYAIDSKSLEIKDRIIGIAHDNVLSGADAGILIEYPNRNVALIHHGAYGNPYAQEFTIGYTQNTASDTTIINDTANVITVNVLGDLHTQNNMTVESGGSYFGDGTTLTGVALSSDMTSNASRISNLETSNDYIWSNISILENANIVQGDLITNLRTDLSDNTSRISNLETSNDYIWSNISILENANTVQGDLITNLRTDLSDNTSRISNLETSNDYIWSNISILENANAVQGDLITNLRTDLSDNTSRISNLETSNDYIWSNISILENANTVQGDLITNLRTDLSDNTSRISNLETSNEYIWSNISILENANIVQGDLITNLRTDLSDNTSRVSNLETSNADIWSNLRLLTFDDVVNVNNTTSNTVQFTNPTTALVTDLTSNVDIKLNQLSNVVITSPQTDQLLVYDGTDWVNEYNIHNFIKVHNTTGSTLYKGNVVYIVDSFNNNVSNVDLAKSDSSSTMPAIGLVYEDILDSQEGSAVAYGKVQGIDTTGFTEGQTVYVSNTSAGNIMNTKPYGLADQIQNVGICIKVHQNNGIVFVTGVGRSNDIPNALVVADETDINYVYVNNTNNDLKKIEPSNLLTQLQTLEQVVNTGNTVSNVINVTGLTTTANVEVGSNISIAGLTTNKIPIVGAGNILEDSLISKANGAIVISSDVEILGNILVDGNSYTIESNSLVINDRIIGIANNNVSHELDVGIIMQHPGKNIALIHHGESQGDQDPHDHTFTIGYTQNTITDNHIFDDSNLITVEILGNLITQNNLTVTSGSYYGDGTTLSGVALSADLSDNASRISNLETSNLQIHIDLSDNTSRISNLETSNDYIWSNISILENANTVQGGLITDLRTDLSDNTSRISNLETSNDYIWSNISILENANTVQGDLITNLRTDLSDNTSRISNLETSNDYIWSNISILENANTVQGGLITDLRTDLSDNTSRISNLETSNDYIWSNISILENANIVQGDLITNLRTDLSDNTSRISNLETSNEYIWSNLQSLTFDNVVNVNNATSNTVQFTNTGTSLIASGTVEAVTFKGSGAELTNIPPSAITGTLSQWSDGANNDVYIASNVGIGNVHTLTSNTLQVGANLYVRDAGANVLTVHGNVVSTGKFLGDGTELTGLALESDLDSNVLRISNLETSNDYIWSNISILENANTVQGDLITNLRTDLSGNVIKINNLDTNLTANSVRIGYLETRVTNLETSNAQIYINLEDNASRITFLTDDLTDNASRISNLETSNAQIYINLDDNASRITFLTDDLTDNASRISNLETSNAQIYINLDDNSSRITRLTDDLTDNASRISNLETSNAQIYINLDDNSSRITFLTDDLTDNASRISNLETSNAQIYINLDDNSSRITFLTDDLTDNASRISNLETSNAQIYINLDDNSSRISNLTFDDVINVNNATSNTVQFTNTTTSFVASGNVIISGDVTSNTLLLTNTDVGLVATGNVEANYFIGDGSQLTGIAATLDEIVNNGNVTSNTLLLTNTDVGLVATGNVEANYFIGDGSQLQNLTIPGGSGGVWNTNAEGEIYFATSNVGIANTDPGHDLSVGSNLYVDDDGSNVLVVNGNVSIGSTLTLDSFAITVSQGLDDIMNVSNTSSNTMQLTNADVGLVTTGNVEIGGELTISSNLTVSNVNFTGNLYQNGTLFQGGGGGGGVWTETGNDIYYTTGNVGIGTTNPGANLHVEGNAYISGTTISSELTESTSVSVGWATSIAGQTDSDHGEDIALDGNGNVYAIGHYMSSTLDVRSQGSTTTATQLSNPSTNYRTIYIAQYDTSGNVQWAANMGGTNDDYARAVAVSSDGNVYVTGDFLSSTLNVYSKNQAIPNRQLSNSGINDAFIAKYDSIGNVQWATSIGGLGSDYGYDIATSNNGNVYVIGDFYSPTLNVYSQGSTTPATQLFSSTTYNGYITKYLANGSVDWAVNVGKQYRCNARGVTVDGNENVYVVGYFSESSLDIYDVGGTSASVSITNPGFGSNSVFIAKYNVSGVVQWVAKAGGNNNCHGNDVAVDSDGNVYVCGDYSASPLQIFNEGGSSSVTQLTNSGSYDAFIIKYLANGTVDWAANVSGSGSDYGRSISVDSRGNVYHAGTFLSSAIHFYNAGSTTSVATINNTTSNSTRYDTYVTKYNSSGQYQWVMRVGGDHHDEVKGLSVSDNGNVYVTGEFYSSTLNVYSQGSTTPATQLTNSDTLGSYEAFIVKYTNPQNSTTNLDSDNTLAINTDLEVGGSVAGPFTTFLTGDVTTSIVTSIASTSTFYPLTSYTFNVPSEYHIYGTKNLEIYGQIKWCGEISNPANSMFSARVYYGSGLTSYIDSAENTSSDASTRNNGAGVPAINYQADFNSTLDSCILSSRFYIANCPVSNGSQLKLEIRYRGGNSTSDAYTNRTSTDTTGDTNFERGTTNFFLAVK